MNKKNLLKKNNKNLKMKNKDKLLKNVAKSKNVTKIRLKTESTEKRKNPSVIRERNKKIAHDSDLRQNNLTEYIKEDNKKAPKKKDVKTTISTDKTQEKLKK